MSLDLKDVSVQWHSAEMGLTLWMHSGENFYKRTMTETVLDREMPHDEFAKATGNHTVNNMRITFIFIEAFILLFESTNEDLPIVQYLKNRHPFNTRNNLLLFLNTLSWQDVKFVCQAYLDTRPNKGDESTESDEDQKKVSA